jgi:hypothetical protein
MLASDCSSNPVGDTNGRCAVPAELATAPDGHIASWKRALLFGMSFGTGFALLLALLFGAATWYKSRPKPWNTGAIKANYASLEFTNNGETVDVDFGYDLENETQSNYLIDKGNLVVLARLSDTNSLSKSFGHYQASEPTIDAPAFIPAKGKVRIDVRIPYTYAGIAAPKDKDDFQQIGKYVRRRVEELAGLVIFDQENHYQIDMASGWQNWKN